MSSSAPYAFRNGASWRVLRTPCLHAWAALHIQLFGSCQLSCQSCRYSKTAVHQCLLWARHDSWKHGPQVEVSAATCCHVVPSGSCHCYQIPLARRDPEQCSNDHPSSILLAISCSDNCLLPPLHILFWWNHLPQVRTCCTSFAMYAAHLTADACLAQRTRSRTFTSTSQSSSCLFSVYRRMIAPVNTTYKRGTLF